MLTPLFTTGECSIFGGTQDEEFAEASLRLFEQVRNGEYIGGFGDDSG